MTWEHKETHGLIVVGIFDVIWGNMNIRRVKNLQKYIQILVSLQWEWLKDKNLTPMIPTYVGTLTLRQHGCLMANTVNGENLPTNRIRNVDHDK